MPTLNLIYTPGQLRNTDPTSFADATCVVIDVLRATSVIIAGLAAGAAAFHPVRTIEDAQATHAEHPTWLLAGERDGVARPGFHLGNSPREYTGERVAGRHIIHTTTNGTVALRGCAQARRVIAAAFFNLSAVIEELAVAAGDDSPLYIICSGTGKTFSHEDAIVAGAIANELDPGHPVACIYRSVAHDLPRYFRTTHNARSLVRLNMEADIDFCLRRDIWPILPTLQRDGSIVIGQPLAAAPRVAA